MFSFRILRDYASDELVEAVKWLLLHYLMRYSLGHAYNVLQKFIRFLKFSGQSTPIDQVKAADILAYRSTLHLSFEYNLGSLRGFFRNWAALRLPGLDAEVVKVLNQIKLRGNKKGEAVRTAAPVNGPFTDLEFQSIIGAINDALAQHQIDVEDYVLIQLFLALGARPVQLAGLKIVDFSCSRSADGIATYFLQVPRAKQRGQKLRSTFKPRKVSESLGKLIETHCDTTRRRWAHLNKDPKQLSLFVNPENDTASESLLFHCTGTDLTKRVQAIFDGLHVISERTGNKLGVMCSRFRRTLGTRAAREGLSELVIAELLDHSDTQSVGEYVESVPEIAERIDRAMAMHLAPIAQAFAGVLIDREDQVARAGASRSRIVTPANLTHPVGSCGSYGFCGAMAPVACYTCRNFQPWVEGPHERILEQLIANRERIMANTGDATIASVNDRLIYACAQIITLCQQRMTEAAR